MITIILKCKIKDIRYDLRMTQADLSKETGITIGQISYIENNKTYPTAYTLWIIATALKCKVDDLYQVYDN
ncbi:MAG: helix-turn-helix transcriptional regulator [Aminipila sp.]